MDKEVSAKDSTTIKRLLKRLNHDDNLSICAEVVAANSHFEIYPSNKGCELKVGDNCVDANDFKDEIMELYELFFKLKGH